MVGKDNKIVVYGYKSCVGEDLDLELIKILPWTKYVEEYQKEYADQALKPYIMDLTLGVGVTGDDKHVAISAKTLRHFYPDVSPPAIVLAKINPDVNYQLDNGPKKLSKRQLAKEMKVSRMDIKKLLADFGPKNTVLYKGHIIKGLGFTRSNYKSIRLGRR